MTKRKRSSVVSEDTLERARQQVGEPLADAPKPADRAKNDAPSSPSAGQTVRASRTTSERRSERRSTAASTRRGATPPTQYSQSNKKDVYSTERVQELLAKPTRIVTEAELRSEYQHVVNDIRSMFLLAAVLMLLLVVLAQVV